jgi:hypothetical protein
MKKSYFFVLLIFVTLILSSCSSSPIPYDDIEIIEDNSSKYVGSYHLYRVNHGQVWPEYNEWVQTSFFTDTIVCFGFFNDNKPAVFRYQTGYYWNEVKREGANCLELQKID